MDAPSIGPKMAERLAAIGILTVQDFFNRPPSWIADRLDDSKVDADTIKTWQTQSSLMCQVPGLRGHDAILLVACEIISPQQIMSYSRMACCRSSVRWPTAAKGSGCCARPIRRTWLKCRTGSTGLTWRGCCGRLSDSLEQARHVERARRLTYRANGDWRGGGLH